MITKKIDDDTVSIIAEDSDDLLVLRRIISQGDKIIGDTTRVIKQDKEFSRPDKGQRIRIRIALEVQKISLDSVLDRLRVQGVIVESNNDFVPHGSYHSFIIKPNEAFTLYKKRWTQLQKDLLFANQKETGFLLVAIDTADCGIGRLRGTHLQILPNIYSGSSGKRYKSNFNIEKFFEQVKNSILNSVKQNDTIVIFGPGETKRKFFNYLQNSPVAKNHKLIVAEGIDSSGEDGLYTFTKSQTMKEIISQSKLAKVSSIIDQIMYLAHKKSSKFTMGFEETKQANKFGAIDSMVFSEKILQDVNEDQVIEFLNQAESNGVKIFSVDSSTDLGLRVNGLGGIVSLLRFPIKA